MKKNVWSSAVIIYIYIKLGLLDTNPVNLSNPQMLSYYYNLYNNSLYFKNSILYKEIQIL